METIWNNPTKTPASYIDTSNITLPNIVRLVEDPNIQKNIEFDEISIQYQGPEENQGTPTQNSTIVASQYPIIRINDKVFNYINIVNMRISCESFIPEISLTLTITGDTFQDKDLPKDGDIISTFMRTNTSALNYLRNDFIITDCDFRNKKFSSTNKVSLSGKMFIPGIESNYNTFGIIGTSKSVCKEIAKNFKIGFSYNDEDDTNDFQNWICSGSAEEFIKNVTLHSWKDNESFYKTWIDLYYDLCFVNVNKFLLSSGEEEIDLTFASRTDLYQGVTDVEGETPENAKASLKIFTNSPGAKTSPFYIYKWEISNNSSNISLNNGYSIESYTFINNQNLYESSEDHEGCFSVLTNVSSYDQNKVNSHIILRGRTTYSDDTGEELARVNRDISNLYVNRKWTGIEHTLDDDVNKNDSNNNNWSGNVNKNYNRAPSHNLMNIRELDKMYITIYVDGLCLQVMRGEKVPVLLIHDVGSVSRIQKDTQNSDENINKMYSGFYIVDSLEYVYAGKDIGNDKTSPYTTILTLKRREWPTPEDIQIENEQNK